MAKKAATPKKAPATKSEPAKSAVATHTMPVNLGRFRYDVTSVEIIGATLEEAATAGWAPHEWGIKIVGRDINVLINTSPVPFMFNTERFSVSGRCRMMTAVVVEGGDSTYECDGIGTLHVRERKRS